MILTGGQRSLTAAASFKPFIEPGISNIRIAFEHPSRFVRIGRFQNVKSGPAKRLNRIDATERFVFHNENRIRRGSRTVGKRVL